MRTAQIENGERQMALQAVLNMTKLTQERKIEWLLTAEMTSVGSGSPLNPRYGGTVQRIYSTEYKGRTYLLAREIGISAVTKQPLPEHPNTTFYSLSTKDKFGQIDYVFPESTAIQGLFASAERQGKPSVSKEIFAELLEDID